MKHYNAGKGDRPRPVNKKAYDETWLRCFGDTCPDCQDDPVLGRDKCKTCNGIGKVDKKRK